MKLRSFISLALVGTLLLAGCGNSGSASSSEGKESSQKDGEYAQLRVLTFETSSHDSEDKALVEEEINKITREEIGAEVTIEFVPLSAYPDQVNLILSSGEELDLYSIFSFSEASMINKGACLELNDLLKEYGQGLIKEAGKEKIDAVKVDGTNYFIPTLRDFYAYSGVVMREDIVEKYNIDVESIHTLDDLTPILEMVHENEPDLATIAPQTASYMYESWDWAPCGDQANWLGVLMNNGEGSTISNLYESEQWKDMCQTVYEWNQAGYMIDNVLNTTDDAAALMKSGSIFCYLSNLKLGYDEEQEKATGVPIVSTKLCDKVQGTGAGLSWAMSSTSDNPDKAMMFLNMMFSDSRIFNLLSNGVEGVHYELVDTEYEGETYQQCTAVDSGVEKESGWMPDQSWSWGNQNIGYTWVDTRPDLYSAGYELANEYSPIPTDYGLTYDMDSVSTEYAACTNVLAKYKYAVMCGALEPTSTLEKMNEELYSAGLQAILDSKQEQLDKFLASKN